MLLIDEEEGYYWHDFKTGGILAKLYFIML